MSIADLATKLAAAFPNLRVEPLRLLDVGFGSTVVETADGVVFRIARHSRSAAGQRRELVLLPQLRGRLPAAVPEPLWRIEPNRDFPFGGIGYRKLRGEPLAPASADTRVAEDIADFLRALHEIRGVDAPSSDDRLENMREVTAPTLRGLLTVQEFARFERWWDDVLVDPTMHAFEPVLRHGDPWYENLIIEGGRLVGVLDWSAAAFGDSAEDFAAVRHLGGRFTAIVLDEYGADAALRHRLERHRVLRELQGLRLAVELADDEELADAVAKLRAGPVFAAE